MSPDKPESTIDSEYRGSFKPLTRDNECALWTDPLVHLRRLIAIAASMLLSASALYAETMNQHSVEAIATAVSSPIPAVAVEEARKYDDDLLQTGALDDVKVYLVTDERSRHMQQLVNRILGTMRENSSGWVVRVLDTTPKTANAFVVGGKYIYVFTGLVDQAASDDELAFVIGHELGHSILKHKLRKQNDPTTLLANLAKLFAVFSHGSSQENALAVAGALDNSYSQIDEREADTFGVLASWRAGYDPLRGVDFFSRIARAEDEEQSRRNTALEDGKAAALNLQAECDSRQSQWESGQLEQSKSNAATINELCAKADQEAQAYEAALAQAKADDTNGADAAFGSDHPDPRERIAAVAALTDYIHGVRPLSSLSAHEQAQAVITALLHNHSELLQPLESASATGTIGSAPGTAKPAGLTGEVKPAPEKDEQGIAAKLKLLKDMRQRGLIDQADYDKRKQELLNRL